MSYFHPNAGAAHLSQAGPQQSACFVRPHSEITAKVRAGWLGRTPSLGRSTTGRQGLARIDSGRDIPYHTDMKIKILGTRGEIPQSAPYHSRQSGILVDGELMLDLGEEEFLKYRPKNILFTHLHPDHAFFTRDPENAPEIGIPMYGPEPYNRGGIRVKKFEGSGKLGNFRIRTIPVIHSLKVDSHAIIVSRGGRRFLYTGDMLWIKKWYHRYLKDLDLVITEGSFIRKSGMVRRDKETGRIYGHAGVGKLIGTFAPYTDRIVLVHFGSWLYRDMKKGRRKVQDLADRESVEVTVGYDGLEVSV